MVGDDVVQLTGDALALLQERALAFVAALDHLQLLTAAAPGPDDDPPEDYGHREDNGGPAGRQVGEGRTDHRDGARADHHPRLAADGDRVQAQAIDEDPGRDVGSRPQ